jgi:oligopeptide transport system substrate-binding protein
LFESRSAHAWLDPRPRTLLYALSELGYSSRVASTLSWSGMTPRLRNLLGYSVLALLSAGVAWALSFNNIPPADFTFVNQAEVRSVDPQLIAGHPESRVIRALFEGLVNWHPKTLEPTPGVAERWDISSDGRVYTFHLRPIARWSNGSPITAHDFAFSYRRMLDPRTAAEYTGQLWFLVNGRRYFDGDVHPGDRVEVELIRPAEGSRPFARNDVLRGKLVEVASRGKAISDWLYKVEIDGKVRTFSNQEDGEPFAWVTLDFSEVGLRAMDDRTLELTLTDPAPFFLSLCGFYPLYPIPQQCVETYGRDWVKPENIVTSGAFRLESRRLRDRIRMVKNPLYWNAGNVLLNVVDALAVESNTTALNFYMSGQVDWIPMAPQAIVGELLAQKRADFVPSLEFTTLFYRFNVKRPPLDNPKVRKALALAIDREQIVARVTRAGEVAARSLVPPGIAGYERLETERFDLAEARRLLAEAGYPGGEGFPRLTLLHNNDETRQSVAEFLQYHWRQNLGIEIDLQNEEWGSYLASIRKVDYDIATSGWVGDYLDPNTFLDMFITGGANNSTGWGLADYDALIEKAGKTADADERFKILNEAERLLLAEQPIAPIYHRVSRNMVRPYVRGHYENLLDVHPLESISIDKAARDEFLRSSRSER